MLSTDFWSPCGRGGFLVILLFRCRADICCEKWKLPMTNQPACPRPNGPSRLCLKAPPPVDLQPGYFGFSTVSSPVVILAQLSHATGDEESIHETLKLQSRSQIFENSCKIPHLMGTLRLCQKMYAEFLKCISNLYGNTPLICIAVPSWLLSLEEKETPQHHHPPHLYCSTPLICTAMLLFV